MLSDKVQVILSVDDGVVCITVEQLPVAWHFWMLCGVPFEFITKELTVTLFCQLGGKAEHDCQESLCPWDCRNHNYAKLSERTHNILLNLVRRILEVAIALTGSGSSFSFGVLKSFYSGMC